MIITKIIWLINQLISHYFLDPKVSSNWPKVLQLNIYFYKGNRNKKHAEAIKQITFWHWVWK